MGESGSWSATAADSTILAADTDRASVTLQHTAGERTYFGFGEAAVYGEGLSVSSADTTLEVEGYNARLAIHAICDTAKTGGGGYQTEDRSDVPTSGESTLSVAYSDLQKEVGAFLGYGATSGNWSANQLAEIERYVQEGIRRFYYPPKMDGASSAHEWSFLKPTTTLTTTADDAEQDLPDGFGRILGDLHFDDDEHCVPVVVVSESRLQQMLQEDEDTARPQYAAIRFKDSTGAYGQRQEIAFWPIPDDAYVLTYRYEAFAGKLTDANPYPLGGMKHSSTIIESCLAVAEQRANDEGGLHTEAFNRLLANSIDQDRKNSGRYFGHMGGQSGDVVHTRAASRSSYDITYKGETW